MVDYRAIREKVLEHMYERNPESFWYLSTENARQMRTTYSTFSNMKAFLEWLDYKVGMQEHGMDSGGVLTSIGGEE